MSLIIDIETIARSLSDEEIANIEASITPDSRMKDPVKIEADIAKKLTAKMDKLALDPFYNQIIAISAKHHGVGSPPRFDMINDIEDLLLESFIDYLVRLESAKIEIYPFVGCNLIGFDLPTIALHLCKHRIDPMGFDFTPSKYNRKRVVDLMTAFSDKYVGVEALANYFGIDTSMNLIDGSMVQGRWDNGDWKAILDHCSCDVDIEYEIYDRTHRILEVR
jgi:hypothetical protein